MLRVSAVPCHGAIAEVVIAPWSPSCWHPTVAIAAASACPTPCTLVSLSGTRAQRLTPHAQSFTVGGTAGQQADNAYESVLLVLLRHSVSCHWAFSQVDNPAAEVVTRHRYGYKSHRTQVSKDLDHGCSNRRST